MGQGAWSARVMSRKDTLTALFAGKLAGGAGSTVGSSQPSPDQDKERVRSGAVGAMGNSLKELADGAKAAQRLQEQIASGHVVLDIDPVRIDPSIISDRLALEGDPSFEQLVGSMDLSGQQVPILVRPHPSDPERYQVAYGHRRLRAAAKLNIKVKAIVRVLSDADLVVAQGKENLERRDLSFIEKALFARRLEDHGFDRSIILAALATDKADLSRYIAVARLVPEELLQAIGPAGKIGRARWLTLAELLKQPRSKAVARVTIESAAFRAASTDERFDILNKALSKPAERKGGKPRAWVTQDGRRAGRVVHRSGCTVLTLDDRVLPEFGAYVTNRLDALYAEFVSQAGVSRKAGGEGADGTRSAQDEPKAAHIVLGVEKQPMPQ